MIELTEQERQFVVNVLNTGVPLQGNAVECRRTIAIIDRISQKLSHKDHERPENGTADPVMAKAKDVVANALAEALTK
jgi:hypothetical protein